MRPPPDPLLTDLYQLTMLQTYVEQGMDAPAVFEFFVRSLPEQRNFLVAVGSEQLLEYLASLRFDEASLNWLRKSGRFNSDFIDWLAAFQFTGEVWAMPEGTLCFPGEPLVQIVAPLPQAQFIESRLINLIHYQTLIASKAARCALAAPDSSLIDFGLRRAHGDEAGHLAARACYLAGFAGTATVSAGEQFGIPLYGTMAHAYVQAVGDELQAFRAFAKSHPDNVVLLVDTYDLAQGVANAITVGRELAVAGAKLHGIRIDSGDLGAEARRARAALDAAGLASVKIIWSGGLDELQL
jgi:nicotinate phosphoribosyltransferase